MAEYQKDANIPVPMPDWPIRRFALWWLRHKPFNMPRHNESCHDLGASRIVTFYRAAPFQVQFVATPANTTIAPHMHPNVESIEVWIAGNETATYGGDHHIRQGMTEIPAGEYHGGVTGNVGVAWFSIQKWLNGIEPTSVELDWVGEPVDATHAKELGNGG